MKRTNKEMVQVTVEAMSGKCLHWCAFRAIVKMSSECKLVKEEWVREMGAYPKEVDYNMLRTFKPVKKRGPGAVTEYTCEQLKDATLWIFP